MSINLEHRKYHIATVLPAYNESAHIVEVVRSIPTWVDSIIVVDDASSDDTASAARNCGDPRVVVLTHERNGGVGAATITGYREAVSRSSEIVVKMDADGQMSGDELARLIFPIVSGNGDYVKGNRFRSSGRTVTMPILRKFGSVGLSFLTKMSSGYWHVFDSQCGFTAISGHALAQLNLDRIATDYFFENDMLIKLNELDGRVVDVPIETRYGSEVSHMSILRVILTFPLRLLSGAIRRMCRKYFVLDFGAPGLLLFLGALLCGFGGVFGAYHWFLSRATGIVASTGTVMIAVMPLIIGLQLLLQAFAMEVSDSPGAQETRAYARRLMTDGDPTW